MIHQSSLRTSLISAGSVLTTAPEQSPSTARLSSVDMRSSCVAACFSTSLTVAVWASAAVLTGAFAMVSCVVELVDEGTLVDSFVVLQDMRKRDVLTDEERRRSDRQGGTGRVHLIMRSRASWRAPCFPHNPRFPCNVTPTARWGDEALSRALEKRVARRGALTFGAEDRSIA